MNKEFGLLKIGEKARGESIPLLGVKVVGDVLGRGAKIKLLQRFGNQETNPVEAVYKFPLPEGAAICGFKAHMGDRVIEGQVEESEKAFEIYDDALSRGDGGYLLDEERPNIFTLSVGNLNPGTEVLIEIEYVTLLDADGRRIRFFLPTTISPRYLPHGMEDNDGIPPDEKLHPPYTPDVPYGISIDLMLHKGGLLESIESPSHQVRIENLKGDPVHVSLSSESVRMDRDFILYMDYADSHVSRAYQYRTDKESFVQLDFLPHEALTEKRPPQRSGPRGLKRGLVFLVDCSGSMQGDSIREAKKALELCLRGVEQGKSFNVYRFGSTHEVLFKKAREYNEKTAEEALAYVEAMDADLGGTEIFKPLKEICSLKRKGPNSGLDIILLTDGEVGNEAEILKLIRENNGEIRVFPVGIGAGCNEFFIKGLARAGGGASAFIFPGERVEPKVLELFGKLNQDAVKDLDISWDAGGVEQAPALPTVFSRFPATVFARIPGGYTGRDTIEVKGKIHGREQAWVIRLLSLDEQALPIPILWARERIRDLEESGDVLTRGSRQRDRKQRDVTKKVVEISKKYGLLSQITSYVAVEKRQEKDKTTGEVVLRKVPARRTVGWHGIGGLQRMADASLAFSDIRAALAPAPAEASEVDWDNVLAEFNESAFSGEKVTAGEERLDLVLRVLSLQRPEGGLIIDKKTAQAFGIDLHEVEKAAGQMKLRTADYQGWRSLDPIALLSTAILILVLEQYFSMERPTWVNVVRKSESWLSEILSLGRPEISGQDLMSWAEGFVRNIKPPLSS